MGLPKKIQISWEEEKIEFRGKEFKRGDGVHLKDLLGDEIQKTEYWGVELRNALNITEPSGNDYSGVLVIEKGGKENEFYVLARLHRLLGHSYYSIKEIGRSKSKLLIQIDENLVVDLGNPEIEREIGIIKGIQVLAKNGDEEMLLDLAECYGNYRIGLFTETELKENLETKFRYYMEYNQKKWRLKVIPPFFKTPFSRK